MTEPMAAYFDRNAGIFKRTGIQCVSTWTRLCTTAKAWWEWALEHATPEPMTASAFLQLCVATSIFIGAASSAKAWSMSPSFGRVILTMALYVLGNLLVMRLLRQIGMATAFSITAVLQLVAVNLVAIFVFGERVGLAEGTGI